MKWLLLLALLLVTACQTTRKKAWPSTRFTEVRAFAWPSGETFFKQRTDVILPGNAFRPGVLNPEGAMLNADQMARLHAAITGPHLNIPEARCFFPHNAFVYYDADHKIVACLEICFGCLVYESTPEGVRHPANMHAFAAIFDELKLPLGEYPNRKAFEKHWNEMMEKDPRLKELNRTFPPNIE